MTETNPPPADKELIYVGDPMCSWCWGFAPVMEVMGEMAAGRATFSIVTGGLRSQSDPMDDADKATIRHHWEAVAARTGQPFDFSFFARDGFVYDTEKACRAVVVVRAADPAAAPYMRRLHQAFYAQNQDVTDAGRLADLAAEFGVSRDEFLAAYPGDFARAATQADFLQARRLGVQGFPTVVCRDGGQYAYLTLGYRPLENITPLLEEWLATP